MRLIDDSATRFSYNVFFLSLVLYEAACSVLYNNDNNNNSTRKYILGE